MHSTGEQPLATCIQTTDRGTARSARREPGAAAAPHLCAKSAASQGYGCHRRGGLRASSRRSFHRSSCRARSSTIAMLANAAPPRRAAPAATVRRRSRGWRSIGRARRTAPQSAPAALSNGADAGAAEPVLPVATPAPRPVLGVYSEGELNGASDGAAGSASADGCQAAAGEAVSPVATPAPEPAPGVFPDGGLPGASAEAAAGASADASAAGAEMPVSPLVSPAPESAPSVYSDRARAASQPGRRRTQPAILSTAATNPRRGATFLRLSGATSGYATEDAADIAILSPGAAAPLPICCRSTTSCRSPRAVARTCSIYIFSALRIAACATAMGRLCRRNAPRSDSSALLARALDSARRRLADGRGRAGHPSHRRAPNVHLRCRIIRPWPWSPVYDPPASGDRHHRPTIRSAAPLAHRL